MSPEVEKQEFQEQIPARPQYTPIPCECSILYVDKLDETIVTVDQPQILPMGVYQFNCGGEMISILASQVRRLKVVAIKPSGLIV